MRERSAWADYVNQLKAEPGIVIISQGRENGRYTVSGLRDPLAKDPQDIFRANPRLAGVSVGTRWEPYQSLAPQFVLARVTRALHPPSTVTFILSDGILHAHGTAAAGWIADARKIAPALPGVAGFDDSDLIQLP